MAQIRQIPQSHTAPDGFAAQVKAEIAALEAQETSLQAQMVILEAAMDAIRRQLVSLRTYLEPSQASDGSHGRLLDHIMVVLKDSPHGATVKNILTKLHTRGYVWVKISALYAVLTRHAELFESTQRGVYTLRTLPEGPPTGEED